MNFVRAFWIWYYMAKYLCSQNLEVLIITLLVFLHTKANKSQKKFKRAGTWSLLFGAIVVAVLICDCLSSKSIKVGTHKATNCSNMSRRHVTATNRFVCTGEICENLCRCNRILSPQQVAQIQSDLIFCDLLQRQNFVAETKIFTKILQYTRSDLSLRRVASPCCCN